LEDQLTAKWNIAGALAALSVATVIGLAAPVGAQTGGDAARGRTLFQQRCMACHGIAGAGGAIGPRLIGVVGRRAGATTFKYSPAMKNSGKVWSADTLDSYLRSPTAYVPGARMAVATANPNDRRDIIAFLGSLR
jgi:cytochrome c